MKPAARFFGKIFKTPAAILPEQNKCEHNSFEILIKSVQDYAIIMLDLNGCVIAWNHGAELILGYHEAEITGERFDIFYTEKDIADEVPGHDLQMTRIRDHYETTGWRLRKNGSIFWGNTVLTALKDDAGLPFGYSIILRDVSEIKRITNQLELLSRQINQLNDSIYTVDVNYIITSWNQGAEKLYGFTEEEALGKSSNELLKTLNPASSSDVAEHINKNGYWAGEFIRKTKTGKTIHVRSSASGILDANGILTGYIGVSFDITQERKLQEQVTHLAQIVEQSTDAIDSIDLEGNIITWNRGAEKLYGFTREEALGKRAESLGIIALSSKENDAFIQNVLQTGSVSAELEFFHKNGLGLWGSFIAHVVKDELGKVNSIVFRVTDISIRKHLEEQLKKSNEELEQKVKDRTEEIYKTETRFRNLVENDQGVISLTDENFVPVYISPAYYRITGWPAEDQDPAGDFQVIHPDDFPKLQILKENALANPGKPLPTTMRVRHKDGHYIWFDGILTNMIATPGINGFVGNYIDITERMNAEEEKKKSEILFQKLFENMRHGFAYCKCLFVNGKLTDWLYLMVNNEYETMLGLNNIVGKKISEILPGVFESDPEYSDIFGRVALTGEPEKFETHVASLGKWFSISVYSPDKEYFVGLVDDITERKQSEEKIKKINIELEERVVERTEQLRIINEGLELKVKERTAEVLASEKRFRAFVENDQGIISLMDKNFEPFYLSPAFERILGWTPEERIAMGGYAIAHPDDVETAKIIAKKINDNPGKPFSITTRGLHKNGHYVWLEGIMTNMLDDPGIGGILSNFIDITERRKAEEEKQQSEVLYRNLFENMNHGFAYCKCIFENGELTDWTYLVVNREYELMVGIDNISGKKLSDVIPALLETDPAFGEIFTRVALSGTAEKFEIYVAPLEKWFSVTLYSPAREYFVALAEHITERKQQEERITKINTELEQRVTERTEQLRKINEDLESTIKERTQDVFKAERRFRAFVDNEQSIISMLDKNFQTLYISPAYGRITGWSEEERKNAEGLDLVHPDDIPDLLVMQKNVLENPGKPVHAKVRLKHKNGNYIWTEGIVTNMIHVPGIEAIISNLADISEKKKAEEEKHKSEILYRNLFENMQQGFAYCKCIYEGDQLTDFIYVAVNAEYELMMGMENMEGKKVSELFPGMLESDPLYAKILGGVSLTGQSEKFETYVQAVGLWMLVSLFSAEKGYFVVLQNDITERKQAEEQVKRLNTILEERVEKRTNELKKTNEELEAFSYSISHDLRAPLRGIIGFTAMLEEDYISQLDEEAQRIVTVIKNNTLKMGHLIDDLLSFSRTGRLDIIKTAFETDVMVAEIITEINLLQAKDQPVEWTVHPLPSVKADITTIRQVWVNLISNAVKYSGKAALSRVEIGSFVQDDQIVFFVKDNGTGFDEKYKHKLFRVFQRLHSADDFEGTGIGLAIVEKIISKHNGKVWAEAEVNKGAVFYFSLPDDTK